MTTPDYVKIEVGTMEMYYFHRNGGKININTSEDFSMINMQWRWKGRLILQTWISREELACYIFGV